MVLTKFFTSQKITFVTIFSVLLIQTYSNQLKYYISNVTIKFEVFETKVTLLSSEYFLDINFESLLKVLTTQESLTSPLNIDKSNTCDDELIGQLPKSTFYITIIFKDSDSDTLTKCSYQDSTAYQIETNPKKLENVFRSARNLIHLFSDQNKQNVMFLSSPQSRALNTNISENDKCEDGFYLMNNSVCKPCQSGCKTCTHLGCLNCIQGFYFNSNSSECKKCLNSFECSSNCSSTTVANATITNTFTSLLIYFTTLIDTESLSCESAISTSGSFGSNWSCAVKGKLLTVFLGLDYQLDDYSIVTIFTDFLFLKPCIAKMTYNLTAKFQETPPIPTGVIKGVARASLACSGAVLEYIIDNIEGTAGMPPIAKWSAEIIPENQSINDYISTLTGLRIEIPTSMFQFVHSTLMINVELFNPMLKSSWITFKSELLVSKTISVKIDLGTEITVKASNKLILNAKVENNCGLNNEINYLWTLSSTNNSNFNISESLNSNHFKLIIAGNTLAAYYHYIFTVTIISGSIKESTSIKVNTLPDDLVILFDRKDGNISSLIDLIVNASDSYNPNKPSSTLQFIWSCIDPENNQRCIGQDNQVLIQEESSPILTIPAPRLPLNKKLKISLLVKSPEDSKRSEKSVIFQISEGLSTNIKLFFADKMIEPSKSFTLDSIVLSNLNYTLSWVQLKGSTLDIIPNHFPSLMLQANTLRPAEAYQFLLTATETKTKNSASALVEFETNEPPRCFSGLKISPVTGLAFKTVFSLSIDSCLDEKSENYPLSYTYGINFNFPKVKLTVFRSQRFTRVEVKFVQPTNFSAFVNVCDQLLGCTLVESTGEARVREDKKRNLVKDPIQVFKELCSDNVESTIFYATSVIIYLKMSKYQINQIYADVFKYIKEEDVDVHLIEMVTTMVTQIVNRHSELVDESIIQVCLNDLRGLAKNCSQELSTNLISQLVFLGTEIIRVKKNLSYIPIVSDFLDEVLEVYSHNFLPGTIITNLTSSDFLFFKYREISSHYKEKSITFDKNASVFIESLSFDDHDMIDLNFKLFPDPDGFSDMFEVSFSRCGTYSNNFITRIPDEKVYLTTPTLFIQLQQYKNPKQNLICQYFSQGSWKVDNCKIELKDKTVQLRISHNSLYRLFDPESGSSGADEDSSKNKAPIILICVFTSCLVIGYAICWFKDKHDRKNHQFNHVVSQATDGEMIRKESTKVNDLTENEVQVVANNGYLRDHLALSIFINDQRFNKADRFLTLWMILEIQFTVEGIFIGYSVFETEVISTMVLSAIIAVLITIPINVFSFCNIRQNSQRLCKVITVLTFIAFNFNFIVIVSIAINISSGHTTWVLSFFWGILFEFIIEGIFMVAKHLITHLKALSA